MNEWQPIETVPKDGRALILTDGRSVEVCAWNPVVKGDHWPWVMFEGVQSHGPYGCCDQEDDERIEVNGWMKDAPTHWMPLPAPPQPPEAP